MTWRCDLVSVNYGPTSRNNTNHATVHGPYVIGTIFPNINEAREALLLWTVEKELSYRQKISDPRKYVAECTSGSESCEFRLRFTIQKQGTVKTTISSPHTCPPETHSVWKKASGAKYLRIKYRNTADNNRRQIQAAERALGNRTLYMETWRAARSIRALNAVEEVPAPSIAVTEKPCRQTTKGRIL